ncbi:Hypothetical protein UCCLB521_pB0011 (plasmid) [Levilactobacillus brevis]|uniref:Uncharacterized protein n=1 Tax=Oenococcus alcoholitolerans TaxID=931074 RepID=A0ABR4XSQ0_9LACO|nr:hypothetical protein Q757_01460 [Oenococcus alcoholitolerans]QCZ56742.1 Hypothetical protein UCCLB521_pB0011 [Levilactobacillus brevis]
MGFNDSNVAEQVTGAEGYRHPGDPAKYVVGGKVAVAHLAHASGEGDEGADDRHEAAKENRGFPMLVEEALRTFEVGGFDEAAELGAVREAQPEVFTDFKVKRISKHRGHAEQAEQHPDVQTVIGHRRQRAAEK